MATEGIDIYIADKKIQPDRFATTRGPLQPYDADAACPKCGATGAGTQWRPGTVELRPSLGYMYLDDASGPAEPGWMQRTCTNCDYRWAEAPVDAS